jgi:hypothetical protein
MMDRLMNILIGALAVWVVAMLTGIAFMFSTLVWKSVTQAAAFWGLQ